MHKNYQKIFPGHKNAGFTLIVLLVVVLIIGILAAVALPQYEKAVAKSRIAEAQNLLNAIMKAEAVYMLANPGMVPYTFSELDIDLPCELKEENEDYYATYVCNNWEVTLNKRDGLMHQIKIAAADNRSGLEGFSLLYDGADKKRKCRFLSDSAFQKSVCQSLGYTKWVGLTSTGGKSYKEYIEP